MKHYYKVIFEDGDYFTTGFNGDYEAAKEYYLNNIFNIGNVEDNMQRCVAVEEIA